MTPNQIEIGCDRSGTPNPNKSPSRKLDCPFRLYARKYAKSTTWTLKVKNPEHSHEATENIMAHPAFRKFNEQETSEIAQMSESLLMPRQIHAQLCSQRESERPVIIQDIYNQVKKINKDKLKGRRPIDALIDTLKQENFVCSYERDSEGHITSLFFTHPLPIKLLHGLPHFILMDCTYKTNKYKTPLFQIVGFSSTKKTFSGAFCLMKNETEPSYTWALNQYIEKVLNNTNLVPPPVIVIDRDLALKNSLKKLFPDSKVMLCILHINKDVSAHFMKKIGHGTDFENFMGLWNQVIYFYPSLYFTFFLIIVFINDFGIHFSGYVFIHGKVLQRQLEEVSKTSKKS
ncbi:hypothetical protein O181_080583 [Austropuccinia psidii MF-1]|uniref:MULE transposase domain-containing protein n=1 Tax=Austropuccinia psidii MF-1 TaxID=1389203 RepID=A0A9Q3FN56_9BASI|nr:hypothetical protein [Austropuccinia psidii MF-1]